LTFKIAVIAAIILAISVANVFAKEEKVTWVISVVTWYDKLDPKAVHLTYDWESECKPAYDRLVATLEKKAKEDPKFGHLIYECVEIRE